VSLMPGIELVGSFPVGCSTGAERIEPVARFSGSGSLNWSLLGLYRFGTGGTNHFVNGDGVSSERIA